VPDAPAGELGSLGEGEVVTPSGLHILDVVVGDGTEAVNGMSVSMEYTGTFLSGEEFDSNVGGAPLTFTLGNDAIIQGWHEGVVGMKVGGQRRLGVPPELAYGAQGHPAGIPPNTPLLFDIKLVDAK
jgi:FKBP-type peptidyl-prolyl cis-trans isomerase